MSLTPGTSRRTQLSNAVGLVKSQTLNICTPVEYGKTADTSNGINSSTYTKDATTIWTS